ncbi:hypothetical protein E2C01_033658 [Portunus trituberculatus]|uniref:Uncharacterized protein n=1 Tax=Portunus trituberculatus TaxID=210409 RepID=A0A5B7F390_PORTR|nr:hypothetical protein [Portunus trituberculatus]
MAQVTDLVLQRLVRQAQVVVPYLYLLRAGNRKTGRDLIPKNSTLIVSARTANNNNTNTTTTTTTTTNNNNNASNFRCVRNQTREQPAKSSDPIPDRAKLLRGIHVHEGCVAVMRLLGKDDQIEPPKKCSIASLQEQSLPTHMSPSIQPSLLKALKAAATTVSSSDVPLLRSANICSNMVKLIGPGDSLSMSSKSLSVEIRPT